MGKKNKSIVTLKLKCCANQNVFHIHEMITLFQYEMTFNSCKVILVGEKMVVLKELKVKFYSCNFKILLSIHLSRVISRVKFIHLKNHVKSSHQVETLSNIQFYLLKIVI